MNAPYFLIAWAPGKIFFKIEQETDDPSYASARKSRGFPLLVEIWGHTNFTNNWNGCPQNTLLV